MEKHYRCFTNFDFRNNNDEAGEVWLTAAP